MKRPAINVTNERGSLYANRFLLFITRAASGRAVFSLGPIFVLFIRSENRVEKNNALDSCMCTLTRRIYRTKCLGGFVPITISSF